MADPQIRSSGNFTCVITINLPACDSSGLGIVAVCWSSKNQGAPLLVWRVNLLGLEWGKVSLALLAVAQSNFLLGLVLAILRWDYWKCYCWYRFFNFICLHYFGVSSVLWGESAALGGVLACDNHHSARFVRGTWCLQGLCSGFWRICSLPLLACLCGKRNFLEVVILEEMDHTGQSKDLFLKNGDFKS